MNRDNFQNKCVKSDSYNMFNARFVPKFEWLCNDLWTQVRLMVEFYRADCL